MAVDLEVVYIFQFWIEMSGKSQRSFCFVPELENLNQSASA